MGSPAGDVPLYPALNPSTNSGFVAAKFSIKPFGERPYLGIPRIKSTGLKMEEARPTYITLRSRPVTADTPLSIDAANIMFTRSASYIKPLPRMLRMGVLKFNNRPMWRIVVKYSVAPRGSSRLSVSAISWPISVRAPSDKLFKLPTASTRDAMSADSCS